MVWLRRQPDGGFHAFTLAGRLPRVADVQAADFDQDGDLDLVVAAFGWRWIGGIYLLENRTTDWTRPSFVRRELDSRTGPIHVPVADLNGDGREDFVALIAQQHETVVAFLGDGRGGFRRETVDVACTRAGAPRACRSSTSTATATSTRWSRTGTCSTTSG